MSQASHSIYPVAPPAINLVLIDKHRVCQKRGDRNSKLYADIGEGRAPSRSRSVPVAAAGLSTKSMPSCMPVWLAHLMTKSAHWSPACTICVSSNSRRSWHRWPHDRGSDGPQP